MILLLRLLPLLVGLLVGTGLEVVLGHPRWFHWGAVLLILAVAAGVWMIHRGPKREALLFLVPPVLLTVGVLLFLLVLDGETVLRHLIILVASVLIWNYLEQLFAYQYHTPSYQAFALENISAYINLGNVFLITAGLFGLHFLINYPLWITVVLSGVVIFLSAGHTLFMGKIEHPKRLSHSILVGVLSGELLISLTMLPANHLVIALLVATFYYATINLTYHYLRSSLDARRIRRYVILALSVIVLTTLTASWR